MIRTKTDDEITDTTLKLRIRFDYKTTRKQNRFFLNNKGIDRIAEEIREQQSALLRNVPIQGIKIEDIDLTSDIYIVTDEFTGTEVAYAPIQLLISADSLEDVIKFVMREELRKIELLEPDSIVLNKNEIERILFRMSEEVRNIVSLALRRLEGGR
ncbi:MAG TPA: hypothetical protein GXX38_07245 [Clostridia bacterium]|nr:hypothetical protein [Clostridia bacterium]